MVHDVLVGIVVGLDLTEDDFEHIVDVLLAQELTTAERIVALFTDFIEESESYPGYMRVDTGEIERISASPEVLAERSRLFTTQILRIIRSGLDRGEIRDDYPPRFLAQMIAAIYLSTIRYWQQDPEYDLVDSFGKAGRFAAESLLPRPGVKRSFANPPALG